MSNQIAEFQSSLAGFLIKLRTGAGGKKLAPIKSWLKCDLEWGTCLTGEICCHLSIPYNSLATRPRLEVECRDDFPHSCISMLFIT